MKRSKSQSNLLDHSFNKLRQSTFAFSKKTARFKEIQSQYTALKEQYEAEVAKYLELQKQYTGDGNAVSFDYDGFSENLISEIVVRRSQKTSIIFDAEKVENAIDDKEVLKRIITRQYTITDFVSLVKYLKSCGVDPSKFKTFIQVSKSVNIAALEYAEETGKIDIDDLKGCYTINKGKPYYTVTAKKNNEGNANGRGIK